MNLANDKNKSINKKNKFNETYIEKITDWIINTAIEKNASDIHFEPNEQNLLIRMRIDGILQKFHVFSFTVSSLILNRIKIMAKLDITEKRKSQDGHLTFYIDKSKKTKKDLRISSIPLQYGEKIVIRLFEGEGLILDLSKIGMHQHLDKWKQVILQNSGLILLVGLTGSGKTTTLYSSLSYINSSAKNITTIENPIEFNIVGLNQMQTNHSIGLNFAEGLRALLRQDPDVIMVGEIRDKEPASMAFQAALTGHLVFSSLHAKNTAEAITRILDLGVPEYIINSSLIALMSQRLIRKICTNCRKEQVIDTFFKKEKISDVKVIFKADKKGCKNCNYQGYIGRTGIFEFMEIDSAIKKLIMQKKDSASIEKYFQQSGAISLKEQCYQAILAGTTDFDEVSRIYPNILEFTLPRSLI